MSRLSANLGTGTREPDDSRMTAGRSIDPPHPGAASEADGPKFEDSFFFYHKTLMIFRRYYSRAFPCHA